MFCQTGFDQWRYVYRVSGSGVGRQLTDSEAKKSTPIGLRVILRLTTTQREGILRSKKAVEFLIRLNPFPRTRH
jgi:hypothetical protein